MSNFATNKSSSGNISLRQVASVIYNFLINFKNNISVANKLSRFDNKIFILSL